MMWVVFHSNFWNFLPTWTLLPVRQLPPIHPCTLTMKTSTDPSPGPKALLDWGCGSNGRVTAWQTQSHEFKNKKKKGKEKVLQLDPLLPAPTKWGQPSLCYILPLKLHLSCFQIVPQSKKSGHLSGVMRTELVQGKWGDRHLANNEGTQ
jgi:hypothetical protein